MMRVLSIFLAAGLVVACAESDTTEPSTETPTVSTEPLDAREQISRDMVTPTTPGTPVMPSDLGALDPDDYSRELARFIPIDIGMEQYAVVDELLLYYNGEGVAKVSSTERTIDGATIRVIRRSGIPDDSIAAEETFVRFEEGTLVDFGSRIQCQRGATPNVWTTNLCP